MSIITPTKDQLNKFVLENHGSFQQSWEWGQLQESMQRPARRFFILDDKQQPRAAATFIRHDLPLKKYYLLCPRGPVIASDSEAIPLLERLLRPLRQARGPRNDKNRIFIRIEPEISDPKKLQAISYKLVKAPHDHNPRATILIDLQEDEETILKKTHSKTRYNIRLAKKKGVFVTPSLTLPTRGRELKRNPFPLVPVSPSERGERKGRWGGFLNLLKQTAGRDGFSLHPVEYYEKLLSLPFMELFGAYLPSGEMAAGAIVAIFGNKAAYLHGASDYEHRNLMAPHFLHWEIIRQSKAQGLQYYDLGGVSPKNDPIPGWQGLTRFKEGFGGEYVEYLGSYDYLLDKVWYRIYKFVRRML